MPCSLRRADLFFLSSLPAVCSQRASLQLRHSGCRAGVTPEHYALSLAPDIAHATFTGSEAIDVTLAAPADSITLNAAEITFKTVHVIPYSGSPTTLDSVHPEQMPADSEATVALDADKQQATLKLKHPIPAGRATIVITYTGILNNELRGFYLSKGPTRNYAVTQFESTDARRAFPSFDEPALKATFDTTLVIAKTDIGISNTNVISDTPAGAGPPRRSLRHNPSNVHLSGGLPRRRLQMHQRLQRRHAHSRLRHAGQGPLRRRSAPCGRVLPPLLRHLLRHQVRHAQARHDRHSRLRSRRDGELGRHHLPRIRHAGRSQNRFARRAQDG